MTLSPFKMKRKIYKYVCFLSQREKGNNAKQSFFHEETWKKKWMESRPSRKMTKTQRTHMHLYMCMQVFIHLSIYEFCCLDSFLWTELRIIDWLRNISYLPLKLLYSSLPLSCLQFFCLKKLRWTESKQLLMIYVKWFLKGFFNSSASFLTNQIKT